MNIEVAGVPEPGLNSGSKLDPLGKGGGLKILWRRPPRVRIPSPAPFSSNQLIGADFFPVFNYVGHLFTFVSLQIFGEFVV